jgi:hypothetical protein
MKYRAWWLLGVLLSSGVATSCAGMTSSVASIPAATFTPPPTVRVVPTFTPTEVPTPTSPPNPPGETTCLPDPYQIYWSQNTFITQIDLGLPAPPNTKHGIGSSGVNPSGVLMGGTSGNCTIGTVEGLTSFFQSHLSGLGWSMTTPPSALLNACQNLQGSSSNRWWKGKEMFGWAAGGDAGGGSFFWGTGLCKTP